MRRYCSLKLLGHDPLSQTLVLLTGVMLCLVCSGRAEAGCDSGDKNLLYSDSACGKELSSRHEQDDAGGTIQFYSCSNVADVSIVEAKRKSRIASDLELVATSLKDSFGAAALTCSSKAWSKSLAYKRGTLTIRALDVDGKELQSKTVISGPKEHWFLGLDIPVTDQDTLKYDSETQTLQPKDEDAQLFLSFNYLIGDILVDLSEPVPPRMKVKFLDNVSLKLFVHASSRPLDSVGIGIGYRIPRHEFKSLKFTLPSINIYGGHFWTKEDAIKDGVPVPNGERDEQWRVGVTFDLESMIKSVKW